MKKVNHFCQEQVNNCFEIYSNLNEFSLNITWYVVFDTDDGEGQIEREIFYCPYCGKQLENSTWN